MKHERGQVLAFFAIVLPIALLPVVAYAIDASSLGARAAALQAAVAQAAEVAAQQVDSAVLRRDGSLRVDAAAAARIAGDALRLLEPAAALDRVSVQGAAVSVTASQSVELPIALGQKSVTLRASATARLVPGYESPSSRLPLPISSF